MPDYASSATLTKIGKQNARFPKLCQKKCQHNREKPKMDPCLSCLLSTFKQKDKLLTNIYFFLWLHFNIYMYQQFNSANFYCLLFIIQLFISQESEQLQASTLAVSEMTTGSASPVSNANFTVSREKGPWKLKTTSYVFAEESQFWSAASFVWKFKN